MFMRTKFFVAAAALCLTAFTACSDNEVLKPEVGGDNTYLFNEEGKGYIRLSLDVPVSGTGIGLPDQVAEAKTRADNSPNDENGTYNEYEVKSAYLLIFTGNDADNAKFSAAYNMTNNFKLVDKNEITSTAEIIQEINGSNITSNLWAYVILNKPSDIEFPERSNKIRVGANKYWTVSGNTVTDTNPTATEITGMSYKEFATLVALSKTDETYFNSNGFFMGNSPLSTKNDAGAADANVTTLVQIKATSIYPSRQAAEQGTESTEIFVERALAKVEVINNVASGAQPLTFKDKDNKDVKYSYEVKGWMFDNTAKQEYLTRNVSGFAKWRNYVSSHLQGAVSRMIEKSPILSGHDFYRINFAVAPTFAVDYNAEYFNHVADIKNVEEAAWKNMGTVGYCFENTFDVNHMKDQQSTRVIVKVQLKKEGEDNASAFYTRSDKGSVIYVTTDDLKNELLNEVWSWDFVQSWVKAHKAEQKNPTAASLTADFAKKFDENNQKTTLSVSAIKNDNGDFTATDGFDAVMAEINKRLANITLREYKDGMAYYPVLIQHFGGETPWKSEYVALNGTEPYSSSNPDADYLGRYGVVRNTWYAVNVNNVKTLGESGMPENGGKWDDSVERYLSVKIHTVKWQKRTQNTDL